MLSAVSPAAGLATTDTPVERQNLWTAPITVNDDTIGLAIIWINPASVAPELADFVRDPDLARALSDVPADSYVVRDEQRDHVGVFTATEKRFAESARDLVDQRFAGQAGERVHPSLVGR